MNVLKKIKNVPGLYRHKNTGVYYERIQTPTANTYESLTTTNQDAAKGHLIVRKAARAAGLPLPALGQTLAHLQAVAQQQGTAPSAAPASGTSVAAATAPPPTASVSMQPASPARASASATPAQPASNGNSGVGKPVPIVLCAQVLQRYEDDGYPDRRGNRKWHTEEEKVAHPETLFLQNLRPFFDNIPHPDVCQDTFDKYKDVRVAQVKDGCAGLRIVDRELTTFGSAFRWAVRKNMVRWNPAAERICYYDKKKAKKAKDRRRVPKGGDSGPALSDPCSANRSIPPCSPRDGWLERRGLGSGLAAVRGRSAWS
jgi:hypothetical protein